MNFHPFNYVQFEHKPNQITKEPKVGIWLWFKLSKWTVCESAQVATECDSAKPPCHASHGNKLHPLMFVCLSVLVLSPPPAPWFACYLIVLTCFVLLLDLYPVALKLISLSLVSMLLTYCTSLVFVSSGLWLWNVLVTCALSSTKDFESLTIRLMAQKFGIIENFWSYYQTVPFKVGKIWEFYLPIRAGKHDTNVPVVLPTKVDWHLTMK